MRQLPAQYANGVELVNWGWTGMLPIQPPVPSFSISALISAPGFVECVFDAGTP